MYPPKESLDYSLLPSLDLTLPEATRAIMAVPAMRSMMQKYIGAWKECKANGSVPAVVASSDEITETWTIRDILTRMSVLAENEFAQGNIESMAISNPMRRKLVVIPGDETPSCVHIESNEEVAHLCAIQFDF